MTAAEDTVRDALYAIDGADVAQGKLYTSSGATAEEIAVFKAGDKEAAERLYKAVQERLKNQKTAFEDYGSRRNDQAEQRGAGEKGEYGGSLRGGRLCGG